MSALAAHAEIRITTHGRGADAAVEAYVVRARGELGQHPQYLPITMVLHDASGAEVERIDIPFEEHLTAKERAASRRGQKYGPKVEPNFQGSGIRVRFDIARADDYRIDLEEDGHVKLTKGVTVGRVPCIGQGALLEAHAVDTPALGDDLVFSRWEDGLQDPAYRVEWWKGDALSFAEEGREDHLSTFIESWERMDSLMNTNMRSALRTCLWSYHKETYHRPPRLGDGAWQVRVFREGQQPIAFGFRVDGGAITDFAEAPAPQTQPTAHAAAIQHKHILLPNGDHNPIAVTPGELRALFRSKDLLKRRLDFNALYWPIGFSSSNAQGLSDTEKATLGAQEQHNLTKARLNYAADATSAQSAQRRATALPLVPALRADIQALSSPWNDSEKAMVKVIVRPP